MHVAWSVTPQRTWGSTQQPNMLTQHDTTISVFLQQKKLRGRNKELLVASVQVRFCYQIGSHFDTKLVTKINNNQLSVCRAFRISTKSLVGPCYSFWK